MFVGADAGVASQSLAACRAMSWTNLMRLVDDEEGPLEDRASEAIVAADINVLPVPGIYGSFNGANS